MVVVIVLAGIYATTGGTFSYVNAGTKSTGISTTGATANPGGTCPTQAQAFQVGAYYINYDNTPATNTSVATTWQLYAQGATTAQATGTTSTSGYNSLTTSGSLTGLNCNANYTYDAGDNSNLLEGTTLVNTGTRTTTQYNIKLFKYSAPSLYVANTSVVSTATATVVHGVAASSVVNQAAIEIKAGDASDSNNFGSLDVMTYNSYAISNIQTPYPSASSLGVAVPIPTYTSTSAYNSVIGQVQNAYVAFIVPQQVHYSYITFQPVITTSSAIYGNTVYGPEINLIQYPITGYIYNAQYIPNVAVQPGTTGTPIIAGTTGASLGDFITLSNSITG